MQILALTGDQHRLAIKILNIIASLYEVNQVESRVIASLAMYTLSVSNDCLPASPNSKIRPQFRHCFNSPNLFMPGAVHIHSDS